MGMISIHYLLKKISNQAPQVVFVKIVDPPRVVDPNFGTFWSKVGHPWF
jgi:hypothetical protein